jgi:hypothetical protein
MTEKNKTGQLTETELMLQWIKKAEMDLFLMEQIFSLQQPQYFNLPDMKLATV